MQLRVGLHSVVDIDYEICQEQANTHIVLTDHLIVVLAQVGFHGLYSWLFL